MDAKGEFLPFEQVVFGDRIGEGGAGRVFRGMYCSQPCALKVSKPVRHARNLTRILKSPFCSFGFALPYSRLGTVATTKPL